MKFYPLVFEPILKERIWGGTKLKTLLNKPINSEITGESWEISTVEIAVKMRRSCGKTERPREPLLQLYTEL